MTAARRHNEIAVAIGIEVAGAKKLGDREDVDALGFGKEGRLLIAPSGLWCVRKQGIHVPAMQNEKSTAGRRETGNKIGNTVFVEIGGRQRQRGFIRDTRGVLGRQRKQEENRSEKKR